MSVVIPIPEVVQKICTIIASQSNNGIVGESRIVGGYVRNFIAQHFHKDILNEHLSPEIDMATNLLPETVLSLFKEYNIKIIPTGFKHGTSTIVLDDNIIEMTTLRKDIECDGRHAVVKYTNNWEEDAARRDFTINAMYADVNGVSHDYFDGINDIKNKTVRFIGDPFKRIHEDYLRIMRYFRFLGYFGDENINKLNLHKESLDASVKLANNLEKISKERINRELIRIFDSPSPHISISMMIRYGIFKHMDAEIMLQCSEDDIKTIYFVDDPIINLAAIFLKIKLTFPQALELVQNLRFSKKIQKRVNSIIFSETITTDLLLDDVHSIINSIENDISVDNQVIRNIQVIGREIYTDQLIATYALYVKKIQPFALDYQELLQKILAFIQETEQPEFLIRGDDIIALGYIGRDIGQALAFAREIWLKNNCNISKTEILSLLQKHQNFSR